MRPPFTPHDIDAVLFDMDGTLLNTDDVDVGRWARRVARVYHSPERANTIARRIVMALESPVNATFTALDMVGLDTFFVRLMIAFKGGTDQSNLIPPIDGAQELVARLATRYKLAIVSTRTVDESDKYLTHLGIREYFTVLAGRDSTWRIKPHPQPVTYTALLLDVEPARCLMVGDTTVDVKAGRRAGARTCAVLCGYGERPELERAGAEIILNETAQLEDLLI